MIRCNELKTKYMAISLLVVNDGWRIIMMIPFLPMVCMYQHIYIMLLTSTRKYCNFNDCRKSIAPRKVADMLVNIQSLILSGEEKYLQVQAYFTTFMP